MLCLYASDYGPADPVFDPLVDGGRLLRGFEAHASTLAKAQNLGQLEAMERQLQRGQDILWCEQGYSWVYDRNVDYFFAVLATLVIFPYFVFRVLPKWRSGAARSRRSPSSTSEPNLAYVAPIRSTSPGEP
jgi:hypothetical protein